VGAVGSPAWLAARLGADARGSANTPLGSRNTSGKGYNGDVCMYMNISLLNIPHTYPTNNDIPIYLSIYLSIYPSMTPSVASSTLEDNSNEDGLMDWECIEDDLDTRLVGRGVLVWWENFMPHWCGRSWASR